MSKRTIPLNEKLALSLKEVTELTPLGHARLLEYIRSGQLVAKRNADASGHPSGNYIVMRKDLDALLDSLPEA